MWILLIVVALVALFVILFSARKRKVISLFKQGNVIVTGLRGSGKDMLMANVIASRKEPYVSNVDYKCRHTAYIPLQLDKLSVPDKFQNFIDGDLIPYEYPYPEKSDIYISDAGVYFPSQYQGQLVKEYEGLPYFQALSRHLGDCNFHCNVQNLNRLWDKIREQSDIYIRCKSCKVFGKFVVQTIVVYDKYDSCLNRVEPYKHIATPFSMSAKIRTEYKARDAQCLREFNERNGTVKKMTLIYVNKSKYDTRLFKSLLRGDKN